MSMCLDIKPCAKGGFEGSVECVFGSGGLRSGCKIEAKIQQNRHHFSRDFDFDRVTESLWKSMPKRCPKSNQNVSDRDSKNRKNHARGPPDPMPEVFLSIFACERQYNDVHGFSDYGSSLKTTNPQKTPCRSHPKKTLNNETQNAPKVVPKWGPKIN